MATDRQKRLECYTIEAIEKIDRRIDRMKRGLAERKMLERIYHGHSFPTQVDEDGRIILPSEAAREDRAGREAFFIAAGDHFEIWKPETYEAEEERGPRPGWTRRTRISTRTCCCPICLTSHDGRMMPTRPTATPRMFPSCSAR
jgi:hypothetical protein